MSGGRIYGYSPRNQKGAQGTGKKDVLQEWGGEDNIKGRGWGYSRKRGKEIRGRQGWEKSTKYNTNKNIIKHKEKEKCCGYF